MGSQRRVSPGTKGQDPLIGAGVILHLKLSEPSKMETPSIANIKKKKIAILKIPPS